MWGAWLAQLVECLTSAQVTISWFMSWSPTSGSLLSAQSRLQILCPSCPSPVPLLLVLSLSQKPMTIWKKKKNLGCQKYFWRDWSAPPPPFFSLSLFICFERGAGGRGEKESQAGSVLSVQSPVQAWTQQPWDHDLGWNQESQTLIWLSHPGAPGEAFWTLYFTERRHHLFGA